MIAAITAFLAAYATPALGSLTAGAVLAWVLGRVTDSAAGQSLLAKSNRQSRRIGRMLSALGNSKLGPLWNPIERFGTTWLRSNIEEVFVGMREDNPDKLEDELARLKAVDSVTRAKGIAEKIEALGKLPAPMQTANDAAMFHRAFRFSDESINQKKGE